MNEIKDRWTGEVMFPGMTLKVILEKHKKWLNNEEGGSRAVLIGADLSGADLIGADLSGAVLIGADLSGAVLIGADLIGADLSGAPFKIENIHQKLYEAASREGALDMKSWHKYGNLCGTTHCRAGWVVLLAGEAGRTLEWVYGTAAAAALIYIASDPDIGKIPDFYCGNEAALADMKERAEKEKAKAA